MKIALDPTPFHHSHELLEFPKLVAELGYEYLQLTPHRDFIPFFNHPRADDDLVAKFRKACADAGVGIASVLPVLRWSSPEPDARDAAVRNWKRVIEITVDLGVNVINTEFAGRPEKAEESERAFFRSMEELLPIIEREGIDVRIDPHPDDFVEDGLEALRIIRGVNSPNIGMVYVACHTFHMGANMAEIMAAAGEKLRLVHVADTMDHHRSHGLRYITNPPGNPVRVHQHLKIGDGDIEWDEFFGGLAVRVHQHLKIGDGDIEWDEFFGGLAGIGFYDRPDTVMVSSVFGEDENAHEVSRYQLATMTDYVAKYR
ncbi:sugar phosphate isomerase/epimerase [Mycolicibacterium brisbanense]|uniref:sugar phosphate isomerase/epimerase family protein n=1 Tax=Mycolicibacterium brisbanense TaxID=146020 RepID=UPI0021F311A8|nr:sugar phosphate isomerase/epimerase family protein [Mycolicibacterium brisbanense]MCV7161744.1 sugar phosphate isomerase/epimerase [Mycolicibacterium brisbanense]